MIIMIMFMNNNNNKNNSSSSSNNNNTTTIITTITTRTRQITRTTTTTTTVWIISAVPTPTTPRSTKVIYQLSIFCGLGHDLNVASELLAKYITHMKSVIKEHHVWSVYLFKWKTQYFCIYTLCHNHKQEYEVLINFFLYSCGVFHK